MAIYSSTSSHPEADHGRCHADDEMRSEIAVIVDDDPEVTSTPTDMAVTCIEAETTSMTADDRRDIIDRETSVGEETRVSEEQFRSSNGDAGTIHQGSPTLLSGFEDELPSPDVDSVYPIGDPPLHHVKPQREQFVSAYERLSYELANDRRRQKEVTLGKRIGFYQLRNQIGSGNFAQVKLGVHMLTREKVAVKVLEKTRLDGKTRRLLSREISSMEQLHHPNVVRLYEVIETLSKLYLILEYASDGELFTRINSSGGLNEMDSRVVYAQVIAAVQHMHDKHIVHRDLKAENIFFAGHNHVKVGDFGFSTNCIAGQTLSTFCGSPPYAAPELFRDDSYYGPNVDVWALGVLLYFMVVGSLPFRAETVGKLKLCILEGVYTAPPDHISDDCRFLIRAILRPAPSDRYSLAEIRGSDWLAGVEFPPAARPHFLWKNAINGAVAGEAVEAVAVADVERSPLEVDENRTEMEIEVRRQLEEFGITDNHLMVAATRQSRSSITGIYQTLLYGVEKTRLESLAAMAAKERSQRNKGGGGGPEGDTRPGDGTSGDGLRPTGALKKRSSICVIL